MNKENKVLELFFNESSKQWHFEELIKESKVSRDKVNKWVNIFLKQGLIKKIKKKGKMPYYIGNFESVNYKIKKRLYALNDFYNKGFLNHLAGLSNAKTVILFGSFIRADWNSNSDIDIFVYGNANGLNKIEYEHKLKREIQMFIYKDAKDINKLNPGLLKNILSGYVVKGDLSFMEKYA